jgi:hypothetical protein
MPRRRPRNATTVLSQQWFETAIAAPQVVAHRVSRMVAPQPSRMRQDQQEFTRMWTEKQAAFTQSWLAMWSHGARLGQQAMLSPWQGWWRAPSAAAAATAAIAIAQKGLAPVHRKAVANARRLATAKRR